MQTFTLSPHPEWGQPSEIPFPFVGGGNDEHFENFEQPERNEQRALCGAVALKAYAKHVGSASSLEALQDLLSDLMHLADALPDEDADDEPVNGVGFDTVLGSAEDRYMEEVHGE